MNFSLSQYWNYGNEFCSIEHCKNAEGETIIYALTALKKNGELNINKTFFHKAVEPIASQLKKGQHCFLNITGNQVLIKATPTSGIDTKIIGSAFPNIDINDFFYQILKGSSQNFVAVCRKDYVQNTIEIYRKQKIEVIGFALGFFTIQNLQKFFEQEKLQLATYSITIAGAEILTYRKLNVLPEVVNYQIDGTPVHSNFLLALSGLFSYETLPVNVTSNVIGENGELRKEHQQKVFFKKGLILGTGILLTALLVNFFLFTGFFSDYQKLGEEFQAELLEKQGYEKKLFEIAEKEKIVNNILNNSSSNSTFYLNRLIASRPPSVILSEFTFQPLEKQIKDREPIRLIEHKVRISGESADEAEFSLWMKTLEEKIWIQEIKVTDFSYKNTRNSQFSFILTLVEDETAN